ncbi:MAG: hypothetical protein GF350_06675 [Chitinivibrionales bacterium]|nr:hypothetical protein [Chitinivibrionales bacterium]
MKCFLNVLHATVAGLLIAGAVQAQFNLNNFYSRGVQDRKAVFTKIDSVLTETHIANGTAKTRLTLVIRPDFYREYQQTYSDSIMYVDGRPAIQSVKRLNEEALDSIEITAGLHLPNDFVAESLYLWIGNEPVAGQIQDRKLARDQYNDIVGVRMDPALLEFWGNGSYNLRIFPARSNKSRKICIVFHHTLDDDSGELITAPVPVVFDTANVYQNLSAGNTKAIGYMKAVLSTSDNRTYEFGMPGLGSGRFSQGSRLVLDAAGIVELEKGLIEAEDPSGASREYAWVGRDKVDNGFDMGFAVTLDKTTVELEDEPDVRIIVVDMREEWWDWNDYYEKQYGYMNPQYDYSPYSGYTEVNIWERAQKYAVLCIQNYVDDNRKFNVVFAGANARPVFNAPVAPTKANLAAAYTAIRRARPDPDASTLDALDAALGMAPGGVVVLISDLYQPWNYMRYVYDTGGSYSGTDISDAGNTYDALLERIGEQVAGSDATLFTIADEYRLSSIARESGGFTLASLRNNYHPHPMYASYDVDGTVKQVPQLPGLFFDNPYNGGITGIEVVSEDGVDDIVFTTDSYQYYIARGGIEPVMTDMVYYPYPQETSTVLRVAGKCLSESRSSCTFTITGKMGGLGFTREVTAVPDNMLSANDISNVQWAFRKSEQLATRDWAANAGKVKQIGRDYHIVTRQTSLLALEPRMTLWEDTVSQEQATGGTQRETASLDYSDTAPSSDNPIDDVSLDELISGATPVEKSSGRSTVTGFSVSTSTSGIELVIPEQFIGQAISIAVFNAQGRKVFGTVLTPGDIHNSRIALDRSRLNLPGGQYTIRIETGAHIRRFQMPFVK